MVSYFRPLVVDLGQRVLESFAPVLKPSCSFRAEEALRCEGQASEQGECLVLLESERPPFGRGNLSGLGEAGEPGARFSLPPPPPLFSRPYGSETS